jgi:Nif-specific regulatory protein
MSDRFAGRYALLQRIGHGGMGEVFLARDLTTGAECALKRLVADARAPLDPGGMLREFEALTRVRHPAVVTVYELGFAADGTPYYTMEYVPGLPADRALVRGDWPAFFFVAAQVAHGLEALHAAGVTHGDLKPSNLLVLAGAGSNGDGLPAGVRLLDFGLAALLGRDTHGHRGTPGYAAPEVVRGGTPGPVSDLYGFGSLLYTMIVGRCAFEGQEASQLLVRQQSGPPPALPLEEAGAPGPLVQLVLRLMAPDPIERLRDARETRRELERMHAAARRPLIDRLGAVVLVGRERELARLERASAPDRGASSIVVIAGDAGAGKSAMLRELAARATLARRSVTQLSCAQSGADGATARALLRRLAAEAGATTDAGVLATDADAGAPTLDALLDTAAEWTRTIGARAGRPIILLDDAESLDSSSLAFIRRLAFHPGASPTAWVWARRGAAADATEDERVLIGSNMAEVLELGPLDEAGVARLASARLNEPAPDSLRTFLWQRAGGHPGLTVELLRAAAAASALRETDEGLEIIEDVLAAVRVPASFEASLLARHDALPAPAQDAAAALAILGRATAVESLRAMAPAADDAALAALTATGLAARDGAGSLSLTNPTLGERLLERMEEGARRSLHRAALGAEGLTARERFRHLSGAGDVAAALEEAGRARVETCDETLAVAAAALAETHAPEQAPDWHERAALALSARGRYASAIPHFERALALETVAEARARRGEQLALACYRAGRLEQVDRVVRAALAEHPPAVQRSRLLATESSRLDSLGETSASIAPGEEALALGLATGDSESIARATLSLANAFLRSDRAEDAEAMGQRALDAYRESGNQAGAVRATGVLAMVSRRRGRMPEAMRRFNEALSAARAGGMRLVIEEVSLSLAALLTQTGRWAEAREAQAEALRIALEDGRPFGSALALANLAQMDGLMGRASSARREAIAAIRLTRSFLPTAESIAWRSLAQAHRIAGRLARAVQAARRALALATRRSPTEELHWCRIEYARCRIAASRWSEVGTLCDRAIEPGAEPTSVGAAVLASLSGRAALREKDPAAAASRLATLDRWLAGREAPYVAALTEQLRAELALAQHRVPEGIECAGRALDALAALPAPADRAIAAMNFARLAMGPDTDSRTPVRPWLEHAAGAFERLGDHPNRERALALLVRWLDERLQRAPAGAHERSLLEAVSRLLNSFSDPRELTQRAMQMAVEQLDAERGVLLFAAPGSEQLEPIAEYGAVDATTRRDAVGYSRKVVERVARGGSGLVIVDAPSDPRAASQSVADLRLRSIVCVPMYLGGRVVGAVYLDHSRHADAFSDADRALLDGFAQLMAVAIDNSRGHEEVQRTNQELIDENLSLRAEVGTRFQSQSMIGTSSAMQHVLATIERVAHTNANVLITGENGTGKELTARILHHASRRKLGRFIAVNCGSIPETLIESELFGIKANVATGVHSRVGRFEQANGGTLFLDEIGEMPPIQQVRLLSAIASREVLPIGGQEPIPVDVRIIAATNRDLARALAEGAFREDLYYRLNVIPIHVPALRDRKADIPALARHFVEHFAAQQERPAPELSAEFLATLMQSDWPGNVRELQNYVERALAMNAGTVLYPNPLPFDLDRRTEAAAPKTPRGRKLADTIELLERESLSEALERAAGNQSKAARELGMTEQSLRYRLRKYGIGGRQNRRHRGNRR